MGTDFHMPDSWYDPPDYEEFDECPECGEDSLTVEGYTVYCMECDYSNGNEPEFDDDYFDDEKEEDWNDD